jgi:hypothetical protein
VKSECDSCKADTDQPKLRSSIQLASLFPINPRFIPLLRTVPCINRSDIAHSKLQTSFTSSLRQ